MDSKKITLAGSEIKPLGTRVGDQLDDERIEVAVILKPKVRAVAPHAGGALVSREEFGAKHGADSAAIERVKQFARENNLTVGEVSAERRTVKLEGSAANMARAFEVKLDRYQHEGHQYRARTGEIRLPPDLAPLVEAVLGWTTGRRPGRIFACARGDRGRLQRCMFLIRRARLRSCVNFRWMRMEPGRRSALSSWVADIRRRI